MGKFSVKPSRLVILGASSGGQLTLCAASRGKSDDANYPDPVNRERSVVQAAACFFPPADLLNYGEPGKSGVGEGPLALLEVAFGTKGMSVSDRFSLGRAISPVYFVTSSLLPTLIIHGDKDEVVSLQQSEPFSQRAWRWGVSGEADCSEWQRAWLGRLLEINGSPDSARRLV